MAEELVVTEQQLLANIQTAQNQYNANAGKLTSEQEYILAKNVSNAKKALSDFLAAGAKDCPKCGNKPMGMIARTGNEGNIYEVGCVVCSPLVIEASTNEPATKETPMSDRRRVSLSSRGYTKDLAVEAWNNGRFVIDTKNVDRV